MALSGAHIVCLYVRTGSLRASAALVGMLAWSQTMATAGTTTLGAPGADSNMGALSFEIRSSADIYVAVGPTPDATTGARILVPANETRNVFCIAGDKLAWIAA